jgi:hypothetical protein
MVLFFSLLGMSSIGVLVQERHIFARERANGFYGTAVYATAKVSIAYMIHLPRSNCSSILIRFSCAT